MIANDYYNKLRKPMPAEPRPTLQYCSTCALSTRPIEGACGRCGTSYE